MERPQRRHVKMPTLEREYLGTPQTLKKGSSIAMPTQTFPKFTEMSNQFNDYDKKFRKVRCQPREKPMQTKSWNYWGNGAHGRYNGMKWNPKGVDGKLEFRHKKKKDYEINNSILEEEKQRDEEGAEVRGYVKLNKKKGQADNKKIMEKTNRGREIKKGRYAAGYDFINYEKQAIHNDNNFKKYVEDPGEFTNLNKNREYKAMQGTAKSKYIEPDEFGPA